MSIARMGDSAQGYCAICECVMTGVIILGSSNTIVNGMPIARMNDIVQGSCGHIGILLGTTKHIVNGLPMAIIGSQFQGVFSGSIITGSHNTTSV